MLAGDRDRRPFWSFNMTTLEHLEQLIADAERCSTGYEDTSDPVARMAKRLGGMRACLCVIAANVREAVRQEREAAHVV